VPTAILLKDVDNLGERGTVVDVSRATCATSSSAEARPARHAGLDRGRRPAQEAAERAAAQAAERARSRRTPYQDRPPFPPRPAPTAASTAR
jgi:hypothetical protein